MKNFITFTFFSAILLILSGCGSAANTPAAVKPAGPPSSGPQAGPSAETSSVDIRNFAFNPSSLTIAKGATVTWTNSDSSIHKITSSAFNSPDMAMGEKFSFTFSQAGTYDYSCSIHPSMTGKIIVQ